MHRFEFVTYVYKIYNVFAGFSSSTFAYIHMSNIGYVASHR